MAGRGRRGSGARRGHVIATSLGSLLAQDYPGDFAIVLVDDQSGDGTAQVARDAAAASPHPERLSILSGAQLPEAGPEKSGRWRKA